MSYRWDETWHRLRDWTSGQGASERLAGQLLLDDGFTSLDPSHPLGGPDGRKDAIARRAGDKWIMAVYFPRGEQSFSIMKSKFLHDAQGVTINDAIGIAFVSNQEISLAEREDLRSAVSCAVEIYHIERITAILDKPSMQLIRAQFLGINEHDSILASAPIIVHTVPDWITPSRLYGRDDQIAGLSEFLSRDPDGNDKPVCVISGMPGIGKTALAFHMAARAEVTAHFSGGVVAVDFNGYSSGPGQALQAQQILPSILSALECTDAESDVNKMYIRYHELLSDKHEKGEPVLLLFDNVSDVGQIGPLIPASNRHRVMVTSRNSISARLQNAINVELATLSIDDAATLLRERSGARGEGEVDQTNHGTLHDAQLELAEICGKLPIALQLTAEILKSEPCLAPSTLVQELQAEKTRLAGLEFEDAAVRSAFHGSYARLDSDVAQCFRFMAIHPGPGISVESVAAMLSKPELDVRRQIRRLESAHLIDRNSESDTWRLHDLLRLYGRELFENKDGPNASEISITQLCEHYFKKLEQANEWLNASSIEGDRGIFESASAALEWLGVEVFSIVACARQSWRAGSSIDAFQLAVDVGLFLNIRQDYAVSLSMGELALAAAQDLGDAEKEAGALNNVGLALNSMGEASEAKAKFLLAAKKYREVGNLSGEATVLLGLSEALRAEGSIAASIGPLRRAVRLCMEAKDGREAGFALTNLGIALREGGDYDQAVNLLSTALKIHEESGALRAQASTLTHLGTALSQAGRHAEGLPFIERSFERSKEVGDEAGMVSASMNMGNVFRVMRRFSDAERCYLLALTISEDFEDDSSLALVLFNLSRFYAATNRPADAAQASERLAGLNPRNLPADARRRMYSGR